MTHAAPLRFDHLRSTRPRIEPLRAIVLHHTAGPNPPEQVYRTLVGRNLSVHFVIGSDGRIVQMASTSLVCLHAGKANAWSIGIEVVSPGVPGDPKGTARQRYAAALTAKERARGIQRAVYTDAIRGQASAMLDFTAAQTESLTMLVESLCDELSIPKQVPTEDDGSLARRQLTPGELRAFRGVMGHFHCHDTKRDPGTAPLERLRVRWL